MDILILHRIPYYKMNYHRGIDHKRHRVTYIGTKDDLVNIPERLSCTRIIRPGNSNTVDEVISILSSSRCAYDRVFSLAANELMDAALVRARFDIVGPTPAQVVKIRDKMMMKTMVKNQGLAVPEYTSLDNFISLHKPALHNENVNSLLNKKRWSGRLVLKPVAGDDSGDIKIYKHKRHLLWALRNKATGIKELDKNNCDYQYYEVEKIVNGPIIHFDGLVANGEIAVVIVSRYIGNFLKYASGRPLGSIQIDMDEQDRQWVRDILSAVELTKGCFHLKAAIGKNGLIFLEVANRAESTDVEDTFEMATGVHLPSAELKLWLNEKIELPYYKRSAKYGWFVFPGHHYNRDFCQIRNSEKFRKSEHIVRWYQLSPAQKLTKKITYQSIKVPIAGVAKANSSHLLKNFIQEMFDHIHVTEGKILYQ